MIKIFKFIILSFISISIYSQNSIVISDKPGQSSDPSAILEMISDDKGLLLPRMETSNRNNIQQPAESLIIFNTKTKCVEIYLGEKWQEIWCMPPFNCGDSIAFEYPSGTGEYVTYGTLSKVYNEGEVNEVTHCWMDRNLGAQRVAEAPNDNQSYGDSFQWGRLDDGHQSRTSETTTDLAESDIPGHPYFILNPGDWREDKNFNRWAIGENDPCPYGWRVPSKEEYEIELSSWESSDGDGGFESVLKFPFTGIRNNSNGLFPGHLMSFGYYWTSNTAGDEDNATGMIFGETIANINTGYRGRGKAVRCILD